jgi:DNA invertase Pin-like site-specific DNA recombinase
MSETLNPFTNSCDSVTDGRLRWVFYGRYSGKRQKRASIVDQRRNCTEAADAEGWVAVLESFRADEEKAGTTLFGRDGIQDLIAMVKQVPRPFDILVIDETSRLGRCMADVFKMMDIFDHYGVRVLFVADELMSGTEWFRDAFMQKARADEQFSRTHGKRVRRGRIGRFEAGFNPGGGCYGYKNEKVYDYSKKGDSGEPGLLGMKQVIDPEEERTVLKLFESADAGGSDRELAIMLNEEQVLPPQPTRKRAKATWSKGAVKTILTNKRYIGKLAYGRTLEKRNPETGLKEREDIDQSKWRPREDPSLRIVPDDLFYRVQEKRKLKAFTGVQRIGGMTRTERSRKYFLSGLIKCGLCGSSMIVRTTNPVRYGCSDHQERGTCPNRALMSQEKLERVFLHALAENLRSEDIREEAVRALFEYLQANRATRRSSQDAAEEHRKSLEESRRKLLHQQANLVAAISESGGIRALYDELQDMQARLSRIEEMLVPVSASPESPATIEELRSFVDEQMRNLESLLAGEREALKQDFQRRISKIIMTPAVDDRGVVYHVTGDVTLFTAPESVVQPNQVSQGAPFLQQLTTYPGILGNPSMTWNMTESELAGTIPPRCVPLDHNLRHLLQRRMQVLACDCRATVPEHIGHQLDVPSPVQEPGDEAYSVPVGRELRSPG